MSSIRLTCSSLAVTIKPARFGVGNNFGMGRLPTETVADLAAVNLFDDRGEALGFGDRADVDELGLLRHGEARAVLELGDDIHRRLHIPGRARHDDALAARFDGHVGRRHLARRRAIALASALR